MAFTGALVFSKHSLFHLTSCLLIYFFWNSEDFSQKNCSKLQILDSSKLKEFADANFKKDKNDRKFCKWVENTDRKGEIAC